MLVFEWSMGEHKTKAWSFDDQNKQKIVATILVFIEFKDRG